MSTVYTNQNAEAAPVYRMVPFAGSRSALWMLENVTGILAGKVTFNRKYTRELLAWGYLAKCYPDMPHAVIENLLNGHYSIVDGPEGVTIEVSTEFGDEPTDGGN